eukprot:TRINITY_DN8568_c0_g1_i2.p1 TRINITY_DN8568_c0_g1~~TRINITY_DN8568_c0_g1_i2.p1  ORF type:complete len:279 (-),score=52.74 TRINITY_DN8568_c0_g1_i2:7-843(-)
MLCIRPHDNVVQLLGICTEPLCIMLKYYEKGSLQSYLRSDEKITFAQQLHILRNIACGVNHLHREKIIHRDLAARNILLNSNMEAVVSDFGFARLLGDGREGETKATIGPIKHMAPESLLNKIYSEKTDSWSFGVVCYEVLTRREPYEDLDHANVIAQVLKGFKLEVPHDIEPQLREMINNCFSSEPQARPSMQKCYDIIYRLENPPKPGLGVSLSASEEFYYDSKPAEFYADSTKSFYAETNKTKSEFYADSTVKFYADTDADDDTDRSEIMAKALM